MKVAFLTVPHQIDIQEVEETLVSSGDVLIKIRCVGVCVPSLIDESLGLVRKRGRVVLAAIFDKEATIDPFKIGFAEVEVVGSWTYTGKEF
jgi:D-arabinose 1-dehydrogenase-like Zn-dependent alcohol dehydrogenase